MLIESCPFLISVAFFRQLILKSKATSPLTLYFLMLRGPFGEMQVQPKIYHFEFTETTCESPLVALPLTDSAECNKVLSGKAINCRWNVVISCRPSSIVFACSELRLRSVSCTLFLYLSFSSNLNGFILRWIFLQNLIRFASDCWRHLTLLANLLKVLILSCSLKCHSARLSTFPLNLFFIVRLGWSCSCVPSEGNGKRPKRKRKRKWRRKIPAEIVVFAQDFYSHTHTRGSA